MTIRPLCNALHTGKIAGDSRRRKEGNMKNTTITIIAAAMLVCITTTLTNAQRADDADPAIIYTGNWTAHTNWGGRIEQTIHESNDIDAAVEFTFTGNRIELVADRQPWGGEADVYLNNQLHSTVSFYSQTPDQYQQSIFIATQLAATQYTIRVEKSAGDWIYLDAFLYGTDLPPTRPDPPSNLQLQTFSHSQINLAWIDNADNETGFSIQRKTTDQGAYTEIASLAADQTDYTDTGLMYLTEYCYRVNAFNDVGYSGFSNEDCRTTLDPPSPPTPHDVNAQPHDKRVDISWITPPADPPLLYYIIHRGNTRGGPYFPVAVAFDADNISDFQVVNGTTYYYTIKAVDTWGRLSELSSEVSAQPRTDGPPLPPSNLNEIDAQPYNVTIAWIDNADNENGFTIQRTIVGGVLGPVDSVPENVTSYLDTGVLPETTYIYRVYAFNEHGFSEFSNEIYVTTPAQTIPMPPSNLVAATVSSSRIDLTWSDNATNENGFRIERKHDGAFQEIYIASVDQTAFNDLGLIPATTYTYRVCAYNQAGNSDWSNLAVADTEYDSIQWRQVDDGDERIVYTGNWTTQTGWTGRINQTAHETDREFADATFTFHGTELAVIGETHPWGGQAQIYVDQIPVQIVSFNDDPGSLQVQVFSINGLSDETHNVRIEKIGPQNNQYIYIDAINYYGREGAGSPPETPSDFMASCIDEMTIQLNWQDNAGDETGFEIERATGSAAFETVTETASNITAYTDAGLEMETKYTYRIRAFNNAGYSDYAVADDLTTPYIANLLLNGNFEKNPVNDNGWSTFNNSNPAVLTWTGDQVRGGDYAVKITGSGINSGFRKYDGNRVAVTPGKQYEFSFWVKTDAVTGNGAYAWIDQYNNAGSIIGSTWNAAPYTGTNQWTRCVGQFTTDSAADTLSITLILEGSGTAWFDDVILIPLDYDLVVNAADYRGQWSRFYEECVGTCHPMTILQSAYGRNIQDALEKGSRLCGFKRFRTHGILNDDIGIYHEDSYGNPVYDWTNYDLIIDAVRARGIVPIIEVSHMPEDLASGDGHFFWYNNVPANTTPPKDYIKWKNLVKELVLHSEARYGQDEVRNLWRFEIWNEPELGGFFHGTQEDYFKMYDYAVQGIIEADPLVKVGGPAVSAPQVPNWVRDFMDHCTYETNYATGQIGTRVDLVTYHRYSDDINFDGSASAASNANSMPQFHADLYDYLVNNWNFTGEIMCTEWAPVSAAIPIHSDHESSASFVAKTIHLLADNEPYPVPHAYSFWVISDIFEEWDAGSRDAFDGSFGMLLRGHPDIPDSYDLEKPVFHAFQLLHRLSDQWISLTGGTTGDGVGGVATMTNNNDAIQVLVYNHVTGAQADPTQNDLVRITVNNIPFAPGDIRVTQHTIDHTISNAYTVWLEMGSPLQPSPEEWTILKQAAQLSEMFTPKSITLDANSLTHIFRANIYSVSLMEISPQ